MGIGGGDEAPPTIRQPGHKADNLPQSSVEFKNCGDMPPLFQISSWHGA
jgi:hypothetical protein